MVDSDWTDISRQYFILRSTSTLPTYYDRPIKDFYAEDEFVGSSECAILSDLNLMK